jgi:hypothetical protein
MRWDGWLYRLIARRLPKRLVYACLVRVGEHAVSGDRYKTISDLKFMDALDHWLKTMKGPPR